MEQNQLIVNANVKVGSKVSLFGWYTWNNVNANTTGPNSFPNNQYNLEENYGPTSYDVHNRAFIGGTIALPRGFRVNPFMVVQIATTLQHHAWAGLQRRLDLQ